MRTLPAFALAALPLLFSVALAGCSSDAASTTSGSSATQTLEGTSPTAGGSTVGGPFPAFTAPVPQLSLHGGSVLHAPKFQLVRFASDHATAPAETLLEKVGPSDYWKQVTGEYGVGPATALPEVILSTAAPLKLDDADIQAWLSSQLDQKNTAGLAEPDSDTVYVWVAPPLTVVTLSGGTSCQDFQGYHETLKRANGERVSYIVLPRCRAGDLSAADVLTFALSHEMIEAVTDPVPYTGYSVSLTDAASRISGGGEAGDLCEVTTQAIRPDELGLAVQRSWSNAAAAAGHEPCVPAAGVVNFGAFIDLPARIAGHPALDLQSVPVKVKVMLFSDGATGELTVTASDLAAAKGDKAELQVAFADGSMKATGKNGDVFELTIKRIAPAATNGMSELLLTTASADGKSEHLWGGFVH